MKCFFVFLAFLPLGVQAQNLSYCIIHKEIDPLLEEGNYRDAKARFLEMEMHHKVNPNDEYLFVCEALRFDDTTFFRERIITLMDEHGFFFPSRDTLPENLNGHAELFYEKGLHQWLLSESRMRYPEWIKKHPEAFEVQREMNIMYRLDQELRSSIHFTHVLESNCTGRELNWSVLGKIDYTHAAEIASMSIRMKNLPNYFDHGLESYGLMSLVIWHNLKNEDNIHTTWMIFLPHIDKAYFEGKIGGDLYASYDHWLLEFTGYQYYGFEGDAPVKDSESFEARKARYNFCY